MMHFYGCMFELVVDRYQGTTKKDQWVQSFDSVHIVGLWVLATNLYDMYENPGWFVVHGPTMKYLASTDVCEETEQYLSSVEILAMQNRKKATGNAEKEATDESIAADATVATAPQSTSAEDCEDID